MAKYIVILNTHFTGLRVDAVYALLQGVHSEIGPNNALIRYGVETMNYPYPEHVKYIITVISGIPDTFEGVPQVSEAYSVSSARVPSWANPDRNISGSKAVFFMLSMQRIESLDVAAPFVLGNECSTAIVQEYGCNVGTPTMLLTVAIASKDLTQSHILIIPLKTTETKESICEKVIIADTINKICLVAELTSLPTGNSVCINRLYKAPALFTAFEDMRQNKEFEEALVNDRVSSSVVGDSLMLYAPANSIASNQYNPPVVKFILQSVLQDELSDPNIFLDSRVATLISVIDSISKNTLTVQNINRKYLPILKFPQLNLAPPMYNQLTPNAFPHPQSGWGVPMLAQMQPLAFPNPMVSPPSGGWFSTPVNLVPPVSQNTLLVIYNSEFVQLPTCTDFDKMSYGCFPVFVDAETVQYLEPGVRLFVSLMIHPAEDGTCTVATTLSGNIGLMPFGPIKVGPEIVMMTKLQDCATGVIINSKENLRLEMNTASKDNANVVIFEHKNLFTPELMTVIGNRVWLKDNLAAAQKAYANLRAEMLAVATRAGV